MQQELNQEKKSLAALQREISSLNEEQQYTSVKEKVEEAERQQLVVQILEEGLAGLDMAWPESEVKHEYGKYGQPLCRKCKELCLDYSTIW